MKEQTVYTYRAQLAKGEALSLDQQRALIDHAVDGLNKPGDDGKSVEMMRQKVAAQANGMKQALADLRGAIAVAMEVNDASRTAEENLLYAIFSDEDERRDAAWGKVAYIAECMNNYLHQKITTKDFNHWSDWQVTINEEFGEKGE